MWNRCTNTMPMAYNAMLTRASFRRRVQQIVGHSYLTLRGSMTLPPIRIMTENREFMTVEPSR